ncbi:MAG: hypothetical protein ABEJ95_06290 [Candidatus Nanohalobium sp.]
MPEPTKEDLQSLELFNKKANRLKELTFIEELSGVRLKVTLEPDERYEEWMESPVIGRALENRFIAILRDCLQIIDYIHQINAEILEEFHD